MNHPISGIQQIGIGVEDVEAAFRWYRQSFGMDVAVFDDEAEANQMLPYTGGKPHKRRAILAINMQGGGGMEIWQYTSRKPVACSFELEVGDLGIFAAKIKCKDAQVAFDLIEAQKLNISTAVTTDPSGTASFFCYDPYGNVFHVTESNDWFGNTPAATGGVYGIVVGVSDIESAKRMYANVLGYEEVVYDSKGQFDDVKGIKGGDATMRRVLLKCPQKRQGAFSRLLGDAHIELWHVEERAPRKIFKDRFWGDLGYIHICFDVVSMKKLGQKLTDEGFAFTVDSSKRSDSFDMGEAAGHFTYSEDPDGTLIEFVETHRVPILKKIGWFLKLTEARRSKPLPNWMVRTLRFSRVKD